MFARNTAVPFSVPSGMLDNLGRVKMSRHQNVFEADFEYGLQPLRREALTVGSAAIAHQPTLGGVKLSVTTASGDLAIRQSRPYHRYQPGKSMYMASGTVFGTPLTGNRQRVGFFDDSNGVFFEQSDPTTSNPTGMGVVRRTDVAGTPNDWRVDLPNWSVFDRSSVNYDDRIANIARNIVWTRIQMIWIEFAWYGAGLIRWGVFINGEPIELHRIASGNYTSSLTGDLTTPWARTGNLPVRYELRNLSTISAGDSLIHWGVSVIVEGGVDDQRGFSYSGGTTRGTTKTVNANTTQQPLFTIRMRPMGVVSESNTASSGSTTTLTRSGAGWTPGQWKGYFCLFTGGTGSGQMARIINNDATTLTLIDAVQGTALGTGAANGTTYTIGYPSRGLLLPRRLVINSTAIATVELIINATLTTPTWTALSSIGSTNSFAQVDVASTSLANGEVVWAFTAPAGGSGIQDFDLSQLFPLFNNIRGTSPDTLTVAVTTPSGSASTLAGHVTWQEAMS
jgi:hypothetical protein